MKATINKDGLLTIETESELESYALKQWLKDNPDIIGDYFEYPNGTKKLTKQSLNICFVANENFNQKRELRPIKPIFPENRP